MLTRWFGAFAEGGTYNNPKVEQPLTGAAIGDFAKSVFNAFPDMSLGIISIGDTGKGLVARPMGATRDKHRQVRRWYSG
jgi:hypothetical protein